MKQTQEYERCQCGRGVILTGPHRKFNAKGNKCPECVLDDLYKKAKEAKS